MISALTDEQKKELEKMILKSGRKKLESGLLREMLCCSVLTSSATAPWPGSRLPRT